MVVDCRSLIEFCRAFERQIAQNEVNSLEKQNKSRLVKRTRWKSLNPLSHPFCEHSPFAAIDIVILLFAIGALGFLSVPYFKLIFYEICDFLPLTFELVMEIIYETPVAYAVGLVLASAVVIAVWEIIDFKLRKCGNPVCKGLRKSVEFDIQLESEECIKCSPFVLKETACSVELGRDHKELEAELKKMAPINGRTVLIFRSPCGCIAGRMEVWGSKKVRRIKK